MSEVAVTNTSGEVFEDGYSGERYVFEPGKKLVIPHEAAVHIFGHRLPDKEDTLARLGWIETHKDLPDGLARLAKFKIEDDQIHRPLSPAVERVPLSSPKGAGGKLQLAPQAQ